MLLHEKSDDIIKNIKKKDSNSISGTVCNVNYILKITHLLNSALKMDGTSITLPDMAIFYTKKARSTMNYIKISTLRLKL